jgi:putative lipoic acid-binding regulatory protein
MNDPQRSNPRLTRLEVLELLRGNFVFPGHFPITVIARGGSEFYAVLHAMLEELQGESSFSIVERPSSKQNYSSYRIEIYVDTAETALYRKEVISTLNGVLMML